MADLIPLKWTAPKKVNTRNGPRMLRTAPASPQWWELWRMKKPELKQRGYSCGKTDSGDWEVCHWQEIVETPEETAAKADAFKASRAVDADIDVPLSDRARDRDFDYFGFQKAGVAWIIDCAARGHGALLGDDMGVGKTIQQIGAMNALDVERGLIVCPAGMLLTWAQELFVWSTLDVPIYVVTASGARLDEARFPGINDAVQVVTEFPRMVRGCNAVPGIVVINYDILHKFEQQLRAFEWDYVGFDESQYAKNAKARRTQQCFGRAARRAGYKTAAKNALSPIPGAVRVCATGTPAKSRPIEMFTQLRYLHREEFGNMMNFAKRYCNAHKNGFGWDFSGASNLDELHQLLRSTVMIRRMKADVLDDLPEKTRQVISIQPDGKIKKMIKQEMEAYEAAKIEEASGKLGVAFSDLAKLRQEIGLAKVKDVAAHLSEIDQPTLVFVRHKEVQAQLEDALTEQGKRVVIYNGDMNATQKQEAANAFQGGDADVFIGTITACGVGLTLTAASYEVFAELEWTPADITQAEDRAYRQGQKQNVLVHHLVYDGSLDDHMLTSILKKQRILDKALDVGDPTNADHEVPGLNTADKEEIDLQAEFEKAGELVAKKAQEPRLSEKEVALVHQALRAVAGSCDGAAALDDAGFNKADTHFGNSLARQATLTQGQAKAAKRMVRKYKRQFGPDLYEALYGKVEEEVDG